MKTWLLTKIARCHPKNWRERRQPYPQLWYCMPRKDRWPWIAAALQWLCGLTGHELSNTEWGYGGGDYADRRCRWCNKKIKVPKDSIRFAFKEYSYLMDEVDQQGGSA